jgi:hypothetical protein
MSQDNALRINRAAATCLAECQKSKTPFLAMAAFIEPLKSDSSWTRQEIGELQTRVVRHLISLEMSENAGHDNGGVESNQP